MGFEVFDMIQPMWICAILITEICAIMNKLTMERKIIFVCLFYLKGREELESENERGLSHLLLHSPPPMPTTAWLKTGAQNPIRV